MKKMTKLAAFLLTLVMILSCISGCGKSDKGGKDGSNKKGPDENAETFTIAMTTYNEDSAPWNGDGEYGEAMREVFAEIEGEYNIRIEIDYYAPTEFQNIAQSAITNGDTDFADIMIHNLFQFGPMYAQGLFMDLNSLSGIKKDSDFWSPTIKELATFGEGVYGIGSADLFRYVGNVCYYNKDMVKSLGLKDPAELVKSGEWTWDKFREYSLKAAKDMNNDGKFTEADRFGCTAQAYDGFVPVWLTSGVKTMVKDANGNLNYNMLSSNAVAALQKFKKTFTVTDGMFFAGDMDHLVQQNQFLTGKAMFLLGGWTEEGEENGEFEIAVLPYPKYTASSKYISSGYHNEQIITVPAICEKTELVGKVIQLLGEKAKGLNKLAIEDDSVNFVDRDAYVDMVSKYIAPNYTLDPFTIMLNANEAVSMGTMRAIAMPIFTDTTYSMYTEGNAPAIQGLLDEMFNGK